MNQALLKDILVHLEWTLTKLTLLHQRMIKALVLDAEAVEQKMTGHIPEKLANAVGHM